MLSLRFPSSLWWSKLNDATRVEYVTVSVYFISRTKKIFLGGRHHPVPKHLLGYLYAVAVSKFVDHPAVFGSRCSPLLWWLVKNPREGRHHGPWWNWVQGFRLKIFTSLSVGDNNQGQHVLWSCSPWFTRDIFWCGVGTTTWAMGMRRTWRPGARTHRHRERERVSETISCANTHQIFNLFNGSIHIYIHNYNVFQCIAGCVGWWFQIFFMFCDHTIGMISWDARYISNG